MLVSTVVACVLDSYAGSRIDAMTPQIFERKYELDTLAK
jgi:meiotically up-regulated gene 157 (Mug157) protein